jgi:uracil-DNA glycosylase family 4
MQIIKCKVCKETISHHKLLIKKYPDYHCKPVNSSGNIKAKIALIGLAPGLHGANKTGVPFTSDFSGVVIRKILDKLHLQDIFITNAVRCYPKNNKPSSTMINNCQKHTKR